MCSIHFARWNGERGPVYSHERHQRRYALHWTRRGNSDLVGSISDGGFDAFDTFGYDTSVFPSGLTLNRGSNCYRAISIDGSTHSPTPDCPV